MSAATPVNAEVPGSKRSIRDRFMAINRARLLRAREAVTPRQRDVLDMLAVLFHCNHPLLPGYVSQRTPEGIMGFAPGQHAARICRKYIKAFELPRRALYRHDIQGLYVMGSAGSVAYSRGSDFDIWVCHRPGLEDERLRELEEKARQIEQWSADFGLEVHFFVFDAADFRDGRTMSLSDESSGSSQRFLLLDEFYRSGLVVAGATPLWWLVPPDSEGDYDQVAADLLERRFVRAEECIDFGGVGHIPPEEFFGAAVWQLYKSITSPYKSVLKLLLMEVYAYEYPGIELLSMRYKRAVYEDETDLGALDPYLQMYRKVEEYLMAQNDTVRLNLARRGFYLKVKEKLSEPRRGEVGWRRELVEDMVRRWGWNAAMIKRMDQRGTWPLDVVKNERQQLIQALTKSYRHLSAFARGRGDVHISDRDLTVLGRRLYAAFERKAGKIDVITRGITKSLAEPRMALVELDDEGGSSWGLYRSHVTRADHNEHYPLKRAQAVVELLTWTHLNGLVGHDTVLSVSARRNAPTQRDAREVLEALAVSYPDGYVNEASSEALLRKPAVREATIFVNVGDNPLQSTFERGDLITSDHNDVLNYSGLRRNLLGSCDLVVTNTWGEVFSAACRGPTALVDLLGVYARWTENPATLPRPRIECFTPGYGPSIIRRLDALFDDFLHALSAPHGEGDLRYVLEVGGEVHVVEYSAGNIETRRFEQPSRFSQYLEAPRSGYCRTVFDNASLQDSLLRKVLEHNRRNTIQVYIVNGPEHSDVLVVDEFGTVLQQRESCLDNNVLVDHLDRFLRNCAQRVVQSHDAGDLHCEYFRAERRGRAGWRLEPLATGTLSGEDYCQVQVLGELDGNGRTVFTLYADGEEFSSLQYGADFISVAVRHILGRRQSGLKYPIYITDMDLAAPLLNRQNVQELHTTGFLRHKHHIESRLNEALRRL